MTARWLADTSVAVPLVQSSHAAHDRVVALIGDRSVGLPAHAAVETYSVLTRLPGDSRLAPADASTLIAARFTRTATLEPAQQKALVGDLATANIAGGAVYDAPIALTACLDGSTLPTRHGRAPATYAALDAAFEIVV